MKRLAITIAMLMLLVFVFRNTIARNVAVQIGSKLLATRLEIGKIDIRWDEIVVSDVKVHEPNIENAQQFTIQQVRVVSSVWQGIRTGVWLSEVSIQSPTAELRFDRDGELLSVFPQGGSESESTGPLKIPVARVTVDDAALIVHQVGKLSLRVERVHVALLAGDRIELVASIPDLIGCQCQVNCNLDAQTFEGASHITVDNVHLDTSKLAKLPLVPAAIESEPFSIDCGFKIDAGHPANEFDPRKHSLHLHAWTSHAQAKRWGTLCERLDIVVKNENGNVSANLVANPLEGEWNLAGSMDLMAESPQLFIESTLTGCQPRTLASGLPELDKLHTNMTASTRWSVILDEGEVRFRGDASADVMGSSFDQLALPVVNANVTASGSLLISDPATLEGGIHGTIASDAFDLSTLARSLGLPTTAGTVKARGDFAIPLNSIADVASYSASADVTMTGIATPELRVDDASLTARLFDGVVAIDLDRFVVRDTKEDLLAEIKSNNTVSLRDGGRVESSSQIFAETSLEIARLLGIDTFDPGGRLLAQFNASCPTNVVASPDQWLAKAHVHTQSLSALGETISDIDWSANLADGKMECSPLAAKWRGHTLIANASGNIGSSIAVRGAASLDSLRLGELSKVLSRYSATRLSLEGLASVQGTFAFDSNLTDGKQSFQASGSANLARLSYAQTRIGEANLQWSADVDGLSLATSSSDFLGGHYDVTARMNELDWTRTQLEGSFAGVELARLMGVAGQELPASGTIRGGFRATSIANVKSLTGDAWLSSKALSVKRLPFQINQATVAINRGELNIGATGSVVNGTFTAQAGGSLPRVVEFFAQKNAPLAEIPLVAEVMLTGLRTESLVRPLGLPREAQAVSARLSAQCSRDAAAMDGRHLCLATATIEDLRYNHQGLSQRMSVETVLHANRLEVAGIRGRFADGTLTGSGEVSFEQSPAGRFDLSASHVNLRRATSALGIQDISGTGTLRVRGRIGPVISGQLDASVDNLTVAGIAVRKAKFPVDWSFRPAGNLARWQCRAGTVSIGGGNVRIASEGSYARGLNATTTVRIENIDLAKLMQNGSAGSGTLSGDAIVRAKNARAPNDLVGSFAMEMQNIQAMEIPVLDQLPKMITLTPSVPGRGHDGGTVRGRIAGGLVYLDEVAIHQSNVQVMVTGSATLTGKLDLDVVASTESTSPTDQLISLLDSPVMLAAPAPVALVVKANELLKDRVVRVHVGGTADRPTLRLQPGKQLSQDAVRFFLSSSFGTTAEQLSRTQSNNLRR